MIFHTKYPNNFVPPSARCNFFKCALPNLKSWIRPCIGQSTKRQHCTHILYNYCTWTRSIRGFMEPSTTILNEASRLERDQYEVLWSRVQQYWTISNNIERGESPRLVQYYCTRLHKTSYWSRSSVVIVLLHKALFYSNFKILWKLWNFWNFLKIVSFWIFWKSYEIFESFEILWKFWI